MSTIDREKLRRYLGKAEELLSPGERVVTVAEGIALLDQIDQAEAERDEWRQTAKDEHAATLDMIEVVKEREARIEAVRDVLDGVILRDGTEEKELARRIRRALDDNQ